MDRDTLETIKNMSPAQARQYLDKQEEKAARKAESLADLSIEQLQARRDKISPHNQAERQPYHDELSRRLLSQTQGVAASKMREVIKGKIKSGNALSLLELKVRAHDLAYSGDVHNLIDEANDELLFESRTSRSPEEKELAEWRRLDAEEAKDNDNQSSPRDQFKKFAKAEVLSDRQFDWETFEKEASRMGLDEDYHNVVREVLNETDNDSG